MYYMQLCVGVEFRVGVEFLFPLAKSSRSFQNWTETPQEKSALIVFLLSKSRKNAQTKFKNRLTNKTVTP